MTAYAIGLYKFRNLVAHNSIIDDTDLGVIESYYKVILKQLEHSLQ